MPIDGEKMDSVYTPRRYGCAGAERGRLSGRSLVSRVELNQTQASCYRLTPPAMTLYPSSKSNAGFIECFYHSGFQGALLPSRGVPQFERVEFHIGGI